jgi:rhamnulokinase
MARHYLACDLGAESGRLMRGTLARDRLILEETYRFANTPVESNGSLHWNIPKLFQELKLGLKMAAALDLPFSSISTDSWGVDYVLCDGDGVVIAPTFHYRDPRTAQGVRVAESKVGWETIFEETGIQFMPLNTIFQLAAESPERLSRAAQLLTIGDAFNYWLCDVACIDESNASTTQLYNPRTKQWSRSLIEALGLPERLFPRVVPSGTRLGLLKDKLAKEVGLPRLEVIASCSHDTGAAVVSVPAQGGNWAYLSSGTWSLLGVELPEPIINDTCRELNFTNEIGYRGSVRLLKNIIGLWLVQECRREWGRVGQEFDYASLSELAAKAPPFVSLINPADARFLRPGDMPGKIAAFCRETKQPVPLTPGATIRCALESLALLYRRTFRQIEQIIGRPLDRLHIVGGGSKNRLLNQLTANALGIPVLAGPAEATATGNVLVQAIALGHLPSLTAAREVVQASFALSTFQPQGAAEWKRQYRRFEQLF